MVAVSSFQKFYLFANSCLNQLNTSDAFPVDDDNNKKNTYNVYGCVPIFVVSLHSNIKTNGIQTCGTNYLCSSVLDGNHFFLLVGFTLTANDGQLYTLVSWLDTHSFQIKYGN